MAVKPIGSEMPVLYPEFKLPLHNPYEYLPVEEIELPAETGHVIRYAKDALLAFRERPECNRLPLNGSIDAQIRKTVSKQAPLSDEKEFKVARKVIRSLPSNDGTAQEARRVFHGKSASQDVRFSKGLRFRGAHWHSRSSSSLTGDSQSNRSGFSRYNHSTDGASKKS